MSDVSDEVFILDLDRTSEPLSIGMHRLAIEDFAKGSGPSGYPWVRIVFKCVDQGGEMGKTCSDTFSFSPQARWRIDPFLDALGAPRKGQADIRTFKGRTIRAEVVHEEFEGRTRARPDRYFLDGGSVPVSAEVLSGKPSPAPSSVAALLGGAAPAPVPTPAKSAADVVDEDTPAKK